MRAKSAQKRKQKKEKKKRGENAAGYPSQTAPGLVVYCNVNRSSRNDFPTNFSCNRQIAAGILQITRTHLLCHSLPSISMSSGSLSCCSPAFCCCCVWWWFMLAAAVVVVMRCTLLSLLSSTLSRFGSVVNRVLDCWWGVVGCGGGVDRSSPGGRACSVTTSALSAVSAGEWGGEVGGGAGRETRTYLLAIRPISAPLVGASSLVDGRSWVGAPRTEARKN